MSSVAAKLRAMYEKRTAVDSVDILDSEDQNSMTVAGASKGSSQNVSKRDHLEANLDQQQTGKKRLRLRENIPDIIPGRKVSRGEFFERDEEDAISDIDEDEEEEGMSDEEEEISENEELCEEEEE